eukprot:1395503-Amorphochlora_amoeboformis.AAC.2
MYHGEICGPEFARRTHAWIQWVTGKAAWACVQSSQHPSQPHETGGGTSIPDNESKARATVK